MFLLSRLLRFLNDSWRTPARARFLYLAMTLAFTGLAIVAAALGEAAVAAVAAVVAPRLARLTSPPPDVR